MKRRKFLQSGSLVAAGTFLHNKNLFAAANDYASKRPPLSERKFTSEAVETLITKIKAAIPDEQLSWLFENCFPNTLDTTVDFEIVNGEPDTYVITGDIDAMFDLSFTLNTFNDFNWDYEIMIINYHVFRSSKQFLIPLPRIVSNENFP